MKTNKILNLALCEGRHEIPQATDGNIFKSITNVTETKTLEKIAFSRLWGICYAKGYTTQSEEDAFALYIANDIQLNLYVTGLTVALIAALNVCRENNIKVTLYHFDRETNTYFAQEVK